MNAVSLLYALICVITMSTQLLGDDAAHVKVIKRFSGSWDAVVKCERTEGENLSCKYVTRQLISNKGAGVLFFEKRPNEEAVWRMMLSYNSRSNEFHGVLFENHKPFDFKSTWNEETTTMAFDIELPNAEQGSHHIDHRFLGPNNAVVTIVKKNHDGVTIEKLTIKLVRRKAEETDKTEEDGNSKVDNYPTHAKPPKTC